MKSREIFEAWRPWAVLLGGAVCLQGFPSVPENRATDWSSIRPLAGQGVIAAVLGGWRAPAADVLWLRANAAWERRDLPATDALLRAAVAAEPEVDYFRINAARIIAFDIPEWELTPDAPAEVQRRKRAAGADRALQLLAAQPRPTPGVVIERARLTHQVVRDPNAAAALYREAAGLPGAPYYAGRLAVELWLQDGQIDEALTWLRAWVPRLPADDPAAQRSRMEARLAELERAARERRRTL